MDDIEIKTIQIQFDKAFSICTNEEIKTFYTGLIQKKKDTFGVFSNNSDKFGKLYFIDGAIGCGKSTIMKNYILLNGIESLLYYNTEYYVNSCELNTDFLSQYNIAKDFLWQDIQKRILTGESFIVESVFTKESKINILKEAVKKGYNLDGTYVGTSNPNINIERVKKRVQQGSHSIPIEKIVDRYYKSLENLKTIFNISNTLMIFDNSNNKPSLILYKQSKNIFLSDRLPIWINNYLMQKINLNEYTCTRY